MLKVEGNVSPGERRRIVRSRGAVLLLPDAARQPVFDKIELLDTQKMDIETDLYKLRFASGIHYTEEQIIAWIYQFCKGDLFDMEFRERIIDVFINSIYLYDNKVVIYYKHKYGQLISYIEMLESTDEPPFADDLENKTRVRISNASPRQQRNRCMPKKWLSTAVSFVFVDVI